MTRKKMKRTWKGFWQTVNSRWHNSMPKFFKVIFKVCCVISGTAGAAHTAMTAYGIQPHEWWLDIVPYLIGIPAGAAFICKLTQTYGKDGKPIDYDDYRKKEREGKTILDRDDF